MSAEATGTARLTQTAAIYFLSLTLDPTLRDHQASGAVVASGQVSQAQFHAFTDTWSWADTADTYINSSTLARRRHPRRTVNHFSSECAVEVQ